MNSVVRDLFRLQMKIDILQQIVDHQTSGANDPRPEEAAC
jgi:hypothetical protein